LLESIVLQHAVLVESHKEAFAIRNEG